MTFTKTTEYALRVLTFMADDQSLMYSSDYLYKQMKIPKKYLQRLLTDLSKNNLLVSIRGKQGGYRFAKNIKKILKRQNSPELTRQKLLNFFKRRLNNLKIQKIKTLQRF